MGESEQDAGAKAAGKRYEKLTPTMCMRLAAPHTWPGPSVLTTVFGGVFAILMGYEFSVAIWILLLAVAVFLQSSVNTLNDWADYRAGTDTVENSDDPTDAVLVYNNPNPNHVLALGIAYMVIGFICGIICVVWSNTLMPLWIGILGAVVAVIYSSGKIPISYLPIGEIVSGVVMGGLIPIADICVFASHGMGNADWLSVQWMGDFWMWVLAVLPFIIGVGMVMATQNTCDIERDKPVGRHTFAVMVGRAKGLATYRTFAVIWIALVVVLSFVFAPKGAWAAVVMLIFGGGCIKRLLTTPLVHEVRGPSMGNANQANIFINGAYIIAIMVSMIL